MATLEHLNPDPASEAVPVSERTVDLEEAGPAFDALSSEVARDIVSALGSEPSTPAAVAERIDTSLQNVSYHLDRLTDSGLLTVVGTRYSEKGREMDVYAPTCRQYVVVLGSDTGPETYGGSGTRSGGTDEVDTGGALVFDRGDRSGGDRSSDDRDRTDPVAHR